MNFVKLLTVFFVFSLSACGTSMPSTFYALDNKPVLQTVTQIKTSETPLLGIEPVFIPSYLDRPQIIERDASSPVVIVSEFNRWAEMLSESFPRVLSKAINKKAKKNLSKPVGGLRGNYPYRVYVEIDRFDTVFNDNAVLEAWVTITSGTTSPVTVNKVVLKEKVGNTFDDLVRAENDLIYRLGALIADYANKNLK